VAAAVLPAGAEVTRLAKLLSGIIWLMHEAVVVFACSRHSFAEWRRSIRKRGGRLEAQVHYLHEYAPDEEAKRGAPFFSEPFDPEAFLPEPLGVSTLANGQIGFGPTQGPLGRPLAGMVLPLVDIVELCPPPPELAPLPPQPGKCPPAWVIKNSCGRSGRGPRIVEEMSAGGYATVRCCRSVEVEPGFYCLPNWFWRNESWWRQSSYGSCFQSSATYLDAYHTCNSVGMRLCSEMEIMDCCDRGCEINNVAWLHSPAAATCVIEAAEAALPLGAVPRALATGPPAVESPALDWLTLVDLQERFLRHSEEARSTVFEWITHRDGM